MAHGEMSIPEAEAAGEGVLRGNAARLYRLGQSGAGYDAGGSSANS